MTRERGSRRRLRRNLRSEPPSGLRSRLIIAARTTLKAYQIRHLLATLLDVSALVISRMIQLNSPVDFPHWVDSGDAEIRYRTGLTPRRWFDCWRDGRSRGTCLTLLTVRTPFSMALAISVCSKINAKFPARQPRARAALSRCIFANVAFTCVSKKLASRSGHQDTACWNLERTDIG